jgi:tetratricopeptide (TPR) repeat protein
MSMIKRLYPQFACFACSALLTACAATPPAPAPKPAMTMASALAEAEAASKAGRNDNAYVILKAAAVANPTDKSPWLRMAQLRFEEKNYGEAIVSGLAVIERDPDDMLAYSLVAASGLRVSSKALADLSAKNGFAGTVRSEAQELANLLHATLKEKVVPVRPATVRAASAPKTTSAAPAAAPKACVGAFCALESVKN